MRGIYLHTWGTMEFEMPLRGLCELVIQCQVKPLTIVKYIIGIMSNRHMLRSFWNGAGGGI